jgi:hypothetical protein
LSVVFEVAADGVGVLRDCTASTSATSLGYHMLLPQLKSAQKDSDQRSVDNLVDSSDGRI